jgi:hypothetical protein
LTSSAGWFASRAGEVLVVIVAAVAALVAVGVTVWFSRPRHDSLLEHRRAIATLREIAEHPYKVTESGAGDLPEGSSDPHYPTDHVLFLSEPPAHIGRDRRPASSGRSAVSGRPVDTDYSSRPTIARLPTIGPALHLEQFPVGSVASPTTVNGDNAPVVRFSVGSQPEPSE